MRISNAYKNMSMIVFLLLIFSFLTLSVVPANTEPVYTNPVHFTNKSSFGNNNAVEHDPINITGDIGLATMSISGDGSVTNPYIIENLIINTCVANESGVNIRNTDKYFVLRDITVSNCSDGFFFSYVTFGSITNSYAVNNMEDGFSLVNSSNNTLTNNTAAFNAGGFDLGFSSNNTLINNTATNNNREIILKLNNGNANFSFPQFELYFSSYNVLINNAAIDDINVNAHAFDLYFSSYNVLINNAAIDNHLNGFNLVSSSNNFLINNTAIDNGSSGFLISSASNNIVLLNNRAINNYGFGFYLLDTSNTVLKNNIGIYNQQGDYYESDYSKNTTLLNNTFAFIYNNGLGQYFSTTLFTYENIIVIIVLIGLYVAIGYRYFNSKKKEPVLMQQTRSNKQLRSEFLSVGRFGVFLGVFDPFLVLITIFYYYPYVTFTHFVTLNADIVQLSPLSGFLLLGGGIIVFIGLPIIYIRPNSFNGCKIAEQISLIGFITQIMGVILALLTLIDLANAINTATNVIKVTGLFPYIINPINPLTTSFVLIILFLITYYYQRKDIAQYLHYLQKLS